MHRPRSAAASPGIVQAIRADGEREAGLAVAPSLLLLAADSPNRRLPEGFGIDADGTGEGTHRQAAEPYLLAIHGGAQQRLRAIAEIPGMLLGPESQEIAGQEVGDQLARHGQGFEQGRRHERHVKEKSDRSGETPLTQHSRERDQVIVVYPDRIVLP